MVARFQTQNLLHEYGWDAKTPPNYIFLVEVVHTAENYEYFSPEPQVSIFNSLQVISEQYTLRLNSESTVTIVQQVTSCYVPKKAFRFFSWKKLHLMPHCISILKVELGRMDG